MIDILQPLLSYVSQVGDMVYEKYRSDVTITTKKDGTPVTNVDRLIHKELAQYLMGFWPEVPIVSEEGPIPSYIQRQAMASYWMLDPLDGTVDFIQETDEFVISLAYIQHQQPTMGIVHHPVSNKTWVAIKGRGVFVQSHGADIIPIFPKPNPSSYTILVSAHRHDPILCDVIVRQREREQSCPVYVKAVGSALKFGYLMEGIGDEYLRFHPMKEWDFAAGHCLSVEAGFTIQPLDITDTIEYGSIDMMIPPMSIRRL